MAEPTRNGPSNGALPEIYLAAAKGLLKAATAADLAVMLVWLNEKAIFCSNFSRVVFDGLL